MEGTPPPPHRALMPGAETPPPARPIALGFTALLCLVAIAALVNAAVLEIQAGASAYIVGEGHWSRGQQDATRYLHAYALDGRAEDLGRARRALDIPLGDHAARLELERSPPDLDAARAGFRQGRNAPDDIGRMIWMYRLFADAPYFREAISIWREADDHILRLVALADAIEAARIRGDVPLRLADEVLALDSTLRPLEEAFSQTLLKGSRWLRRVLVGVGIATFLGMAWLGATVLGWTLHRIRDSEGLFRAAFRQSAVGMAKLTLDGRFVEVNEALCRILGRGRQDLLQMTLFDVLDPDESLRDTVEVGREEAWDHFSTPSDRRFRRGDGSALCLRWTASVIRGRERVRVFAIVEDVSEARQLAAEIAHQANHDALTGLHNRREIERRLERALESARRDGRRHSLCFIDLDQFKVVNDTCGHMVGDRLLRRVASELSLQLRANDVVGRLGGDEFAVVLERTDLEGALHVARKLSAALSAFTFHDGDRSFNMTCSIGVVEIDADTPDVHWALSASDTACYLAKEEGRNRIRTYVESDVTIARRRGEMEMVAEIGQALGERRVRLYAQRIQGLDGTDSLRYELLARFIDSDGLVHAPAAHLAAAERYGQAAAIDRYVLTLALRTLAAHPLHLHRLALCHINISAQSLSDAKFRGFVEELLDRGEVPCRKLCFELTETTAITSLPLAREFIDMVRSRGCQVALDDFGSGLSSFAYLKNLPVDILKIDGVFVRDIADDLVDLALVRAISDVGRTLGKRTIAEGVETDSVLEALRDVGVEFAQGYAIHRPCPLEDLIAAYGGERQRSGSMLSAP